MKIKDRLIRKRVPYGGSEERLWTFRHENGRSFEIRQFGAAMYLLGEFIPNGMTCVATADGDAYLPSEVVLQGRQSIRPNELKAWLDQQGVDDETVIRVGCGISLDSLYLPSLDAACDEIIEAVNDNVWYEKRATPTEQELERGKAEALLDRQAFWASCKAVLDIALTQKGIFKGCHSAASPTLSEESQKAILSYLNAPSQAKWLNLRNTLITANMTLWAAWTRKDSKAPRSGQKGFPTSEMLRLAIRQAVQDWADEVDLKLGQALADGQSNHPVKRRMEVIHGVS
ncbi:hypothetical protein RZ737_004823 [Escherichia coli]|nr:hypothetical protein [Escherichia coli]